MIIIVEVTGAAGVVEEAEDGEVIKIMVEEVDEFKVLVGIKDIKDIENC